MPHRTVIIYTDGACSGNPGPGGWGSILMYKGHRRELSGGETDTTNNRMEMMAVIKGLETLKRPCNITLHTDSTYVMKGMTEWLPGWIKRNWLTSQIKPVLNKSLWKEILRLSKRHKIEWKWIKGHNGHSYNERCDQLARDAIRNC